MPDCLRILGPFHAKTGYSHMARAALRMALLAGYTVQAVESDTRLKFDGFIDGRMERKEVLPEVYDPVPDVQWDELDQALKTEIPENSPTLLIQLPTSMNRRCQYVGGQRIGWTMGESDHICEEWVKCLRALDTLWVPSAWCEAAFASGLPTADIRVMPIPVDDRIFNLDGPKLPVRERPKFVFVSVFTTTERKQWRQLMVAFTEEFGQEEDGTVGLVLKPTHTREVHELAQWCRVAGAWMGVLDKQISDYDVAALYRSCDCYVSPSPEGFGLPFVEAALCGLPSVALDRGGAGDVVTPQTGYPLRTRLDRIIGHMPCTYPPGHRFPVASLAEIRRGLRKAVSDAKIVQKGEQARQAALERWTPEALAPQFREEMDRVIGAKRSWRVEAIAGSKKPQYGLAFGAWGDALCSFGMALQMRQPKRPLHMIQFGFDATIADFLREQPQVEDVIVVRPESKRDFMNVWHLASCSRFRHRDEWLPQFAARAGVDPADVILSQINQTEDQPVARWHDAVLPQGIRCWAHVQQRIWGDYIMLHPISTQSAFLQEHWPYWEEAIRWLLEETPHKYVLTGTADMDVPNDNPRLVNLLCRTPTMMHVLACAELAKGVITTCNAVGHWSVIQKLPALVCANTVFNLSTDYYLRFMDAPNVRMLYQYETLEWFQRTAVEWLAERFPGSAAPGLKIGSNGSALAEIGEALERLVHEGQEAGK